MSRLTLELLHPDVLDDEHHVTGVSYEVYEKVYWLAKQYHDRHRHLMNSVTEYQDRLQSLEEQRVEALEMGDRAVDILDSNLKREYEAKMHRMRLDHEEYVEWAELRIRELEARLRSVGRE